MECVSVVLFVLSGCYVVLLCKKVNKNVDNKKNKTVDWANRTKQASKKSVYFLFSLQYCYAFIALQVMGALRSHFPVFVSSS